LKQLNDELAQHLHDIRFPVKKKKEQIILKPKKQEEKLVPIKFDPRLDMGNLYQIGTPVVKDPVLQGG
jgi:hypothetical protein